MFRPWFGQALTGAIGVICVVALVGLGWQRGPEDALRAAPFLALVVTVCWALFWRPCVVVDDSGVEIVNVLRTTKVPWPAIRAVDTKWSLTLITAYGRLTAWAAPAPGAAHVLRADRNEARHLPKSTFAGDGIRPGDLPSSPSGGAALIVRLHWEKLRDAGYLDDPRLEFERPPVVWHWRVIAVVWVLLVGGLVSLSV